MRAAVRGSGERLTMIEADMLVVWYVATVGALYCLAELRLISNTVEYESIDTSLQPPTSTHCHTLTHSLNQQATYDAQTQPTRRKQRHMAESNHSTQKRRDGSGGGGRVAEEKSTMSPTKLNQPKKGAGVRRLLSRM